MVNKEDCIDNLNRFINSGDIGYALTLLNYLCEIKGVPFKEVYNTLSLNPSVFTIVLSKIIPHIMNELETHFNLIRVSDSYNNIILVY